MNYIRLDYVEYIVLKYYIRLTVIDNLVS